MPAAPAPASTQPNLKGCGAACRRSPPTASSLATSSWTMILRTHSIGLQPNGSAGLIRVEVYSNVSISPIPTDAPIKKPRAHAFAEAGPERTLQYMIFPLMVNPFSYSPTVINVLERALSLERLSTYLAAANGDHAAALRLYVWNTEISAALYGPLQALEILVRNAFHRELSAVYGPTWYDNPQVPLTPPARARVAVAKDTLRRANRPLDPGRIVAELSFGFWERLLTHGPPGKLN